MRPIFSPELVNGGKGDPALYVDLMFLQRALLFDLGDLSALPAKKMLRLTDIFVSHTHMDHFIGFDLLLRTCLGRAKTMRFYGGPGFAQKVAAKLSAYSWNLTANYDSDYTLEVHEIHPQGRIVLSRFRCKNEFRQEAVATLPLIDAIVRDEPLFHIKCAFLDHKILSLAFSLEEKMHVNIWKNRLQDMHLPTGAWLRELKQAVLENRSDDTLVVIEGRNRTLGELRQAVVVVPGQKIAYVTDAAASEENVEKIVSLCMHADILYIEAVFLQRDEILALKKHHLSARQAGQIGRRAQVGRIVPFHFSSRYADHGEIVREVEAALRG